MTWNIVSDSSCDMRISNFQSEKVRFEIVPLRIQVGEQEFIDNDSLKIPEMLEAMAAEKAASSTACPSPAAFARAFEPGDCTVCFTISGNLSGTYNAAVMARISSASASVTCPGSSRQRQLPSATPGTLILASLPRPR